MLDELCGVLGLALSGEQESLDSEVEALIHQRTQARKEKLLILESGERVRDYVAAAMGETVPKIRDLNTIDGNATPEVKEQFRKGNMGITATLEASKADEDTQKEIAQVSEDKGGMGAEEIRNMTEEKKRRKTKEEETREENVSDTDTSEEERRNARKLHAVKMLEKYYTWINDEEIHILEAMLEDCKRRKREYAIDE